MWWLLKGPTSQLRCHGPVQHNCNPQSQSTQISWLRGLRAGRGMGVGQRGPTRGSACAALVRASHLLVCATLSTCDTPPPLTAINYGFRHQLWPKLVSTTERPALQNGLFLKFWCKLHRYFGIDPMKWAIPNTDTPLILPFFRVSHWWWDISLFQTGWREVYFTLSDRTVVIRMVGEMMCLAYNTRYQWFSVWFHVSWHDLAWYGLVWFGLGGQDP